MLKHLLIHPKLNEVIGRAGHHARILIADGNFDAVYATTIAVLKQLGLPLETEGTPLAKWADPVLRNVRGTAVGQLKATVQLTWV